MNTASYSDLVTDLDIKFQAHLETMEPDMVSEFYETVPWTDGDPKKMTFQTYALPSYGKRTPEGESASKYSPILGSQIEKSFFKYAMATDYTLEMDKFDSEDTREQMARGFAQALVNNKNLELTHQLLTYADATTYTPMDQNVTASFATPDGQAAGSANHTVTGTGSTTYSNTLSLADPLTPDALTSLIRQVQKTTVNDYGTVVPLKWDTLLIEDNFEMVKRAFEITGSEKIPFIQSETVNFYGKGNVGGHNINIAVLTKGALDRNGAPADGLGGRDNRQYYWGVLASETYKGKLKVNKMSRGPGAGVERVSPNTPNALYGIMAYDFNVFVRTRWQGSGYSFALSL